MFLYATIPAKMYTGVRNRYVKIEKNPICPAMILFFLYLSGFTSHRIVYVANRAILIPKRETIEIVKGNILLVAVPKSASSMTHETLK